MGLELLIPLAVGGASYGLTWLIDRRTKPAAVAGGGMGALAALVVLLF